MTAFKLAVSLVSLLLAVSHGVQADTSLQERVATGLSENDGWDRATAELVAEQLELSFALHEATGTLETRIAVLRGLAGMPDAQQLAVHHPGYLDAILISPEAYPAAMQNLGLDWYGEAPLLAAILRRPTAEGLRDSAFLIDRFGADLVKFTGDPAFPDLFEALSWIADDASPALLDWLGNRLHQMPADDLAILTELFLTHRMSLRDGQNSAQLEAAWHVLEQARRQDQALFDLLLSHRDIWSAITTPDLVSAILVRLKKDKAQAQNALVFLLGSPGALHEMSESLDWETPLPANHRQTALDIIRTNDDVMIDLMFHFRDKSAFWNFAGDPSNRTRLPCLLEAARNDLSVLERDFALRPAELDEKCRPQDSILWRALPGYSIFTLGRKMISGAPIQLGDSVNLGVDVATTFVPVGKWIGVSGRLAPKLRPGGALTTTARSASTAEAGAILKSGFGTTVKDAIGTEAGRVAQFGMETGLGRAFAARHQSLTRAIAANLNAAQPIKHLIEDYALAASAESVSDSLQTEFLRCTSQGAGPAQGDALCESVVPAVLSSASEEVAP